MAIARDDEPLKATGDGTGSDFSHRRGRFAGAKNQGFALRRLDGQNALQYLLSGDGLHGRPKQMQQQFSRRLLTHRGTMPDI